VKSAFDAASLTEEYAFLDDCPEHVFEEVVTLPIGTLPERVAGIRAWRSALLEGHLPSEDCWPPPSVSAPARRALSDLDIPRFCAGQQELVDRLLTDIVGSFSRCAAAVTSEVSAKLRELEALERRRLDEIEKERAAQEKSRARRSVIDPAVLRRLREQAEREVKERAREADPAVVAGWAEAARAWSALSDVFGDLGEIMGRGWDLASSVLRQIGWMEVLKLRELIERLPQLREIVRQLGRLQTATDGESVAEKLLLPVRRVEEERRQVRTPLAPTEMRGIERSGEVARMLPVEASLLGHPQLRLLWHARRAERTLLTYRVEGVVTERVSVERDSHEETEGRRPRPQRGPILAVIDTSGSMHGLPETVAKAVVLEALRTAHAERRRCFLYAYSGPGQVLEHELSLSTSGLGRLMEFLLQSFGGGTDIGAMSTVVERLKLEEWRKSDVVLVTDGEWAAPRDVIAGVERAREAGTRFHGVQIGNLGRTGLHDICDPVHEFRDWAALGGW
jgi:uncharacterized protein with von Willebrand factor type A (vWA) domain